MNTENNGIVTFIVFIVLAIGLSLSTCCPEIACERRILIYCTAPERTGISIAVTMITAAGRPKDPLFEIICVGDADNDIPMIRYAGLGIAVMNAMDTTKAEADVIGVSNNHDAIAWIIENYCKD